MKQNFSTCKNKNCLPNLVLTLYRSVKIDDKLVLDHYFPIASCSLKGLLDGTWCLLCFENHYPLWVVWSKGSLSLRQANCNTKPLLCELVHTLQSKFHIVQLFQLCEEANERLANGNQTIQQQVRQIGKQNTEKATVMLCQNSTKNKTQDCRCGCC